MPCTTILVGKKASHDGSTIIARNDDCFFGVKKMIVVEPNQQPKKYKSVIAHLEIELPDNPLRYTATPNVDVKKEGLWACGGINSANVAMTATETISSNPLVMGADPYVVYKKKEGKNPAKPGGIGEEDLNTIILPYIRSAREGVLRLGSLLEQYGTYESNGIAFSDENECWWLESIGGHHWIARRVKDDEYVIMPNQFGLDRFDFNDAYGDKKENLCSKDLKEFVEKNHLVKSNDGVFNPRVAFGSHDDGDHIYNTPRAWFIGRYFNPNTYKWDGENADFKPESDNIPWSLVPEKKITIEDIKYILGSHYQGTEYDPYAKPNYLKKGIYRPIGVANTAVLSIHQIRDYVPDEIKGISWVSFGCNFFNISLPMYTNVAKLPDYIAKVEMTPDTNNFYWGSRMIAALSDAHFYATNMLINRYQEAVANKSHELINEFDKKFIESKDIKVIYEANDKIAKMGKKEPLSTLDKVLLTSSNNMKVRFIRDDK